MAVSDSLENCISVRSGSAHSSGDFLLLQVLALLFVFNVHVGSHDIPQADQKIMILLPEPPHAGNLSMCDCAQHFAFFILATLPGGRDDVTLCC